MIRKITERRLVDVLVSSMRGSHHLGREVKHYEKRIDLVALCQTSSKLWSIEAKIENWPQALKQAVVNLAATHRSYIAIFDECAHRVPLDLLKEHGVGLITVGTKWGAVGITLEADDSPFMNRIACERIRSTIMKGCVG